MTRLFIEASRVDKSARQPQRDMSYAAIPDLREQYHPGDELTCVVKQFDRKAGTFEISVKETVPNPFDEASLISLRSSRISAFSPHHTAGSQS